MTSEDKKFDVRIVERNIRKGKFTREDYESYLAELKDNEDRCDNVETSLESVEEEAAIARQQQLQAKREAASIEQASQNEEE